MLGLFEANGVGERDIKGNASISTSPVLGSRTLKMARYQARCEEYCLGLLSLRCPWGIQKVLKTSM